jgi:hypothetical protein
VSFRTVCTGFAHPPARGFKKNGGIARLSRLGHRFHRAVEASYMCGDLLEERRILINDGARYLDSLPADAKIIPMHRA